MSWLNLSSEVAGEFAGLEVYANDKGLVPSGAVRCGDACEERARRTAYNKAWKRRKRRKFEAVRNAELAAITRQQQAKGVRRYDWDRGCYSDWAGGAGRVARWLVGDRRMVTA